MSVFFTFPSENSFTIQVQYDNYHASTEIEPHQHRFYEMAFLSRGYCIHKYHNVSVPLVSGDLLLISPGETHSYSIPKQAEFIHCFFFPERIWSLSDYIVAGKYVEAPRSRQLEGFDTTWNSMMASLSLREAVDPVNAIYTPENFAKQNILHLPPANAFEVEQILHRLYQECNDPRNDSEYMKSAYLQLLITIFRRVSLDSSDQPMPVTLLNRRHIMNALTLIEERYMDTLTIEDLAKSVAMSETRFRKAFKDAVGLTPTEYLNCVRIIHALKEIRKGKLIAEAAESVGIHDTNYFSRLFKKITGNSPSSYRHE